MKYLSLFLVVLIIFCVECHRFTQPKSTLSKISIKGEWFVDEDGRVVLFHGINVVQKGFPWLPIYGHRNLKNESLLMDLKSWGFNTVRLGFMWSGLYPQKNVLNQTYVDEMMEIINLLDKYGLWVIIDMHQDMLSSKFGAYDGAPLWALNELPNPQHAYPWPFSNPNLGFEAYITEAACFAFQCLYSNVSNFETYFQQYWTQTAQIFKSTSSVLGYELINEPWAGDIYQSPFRFLPGVADSQNLMPLYDRVYEKIRQVDPETIVFYEPVTWGLMSTSGVLGTGFTHPPGNDSTRTSLSWHFYCWVLNFGVDPVKNDTIPAFYKVFCDDWQLNDYFNIVKFDSKKLGGGPTFLTEFGTCVYKDPVSQKINVDDCKATLDATDVHIQSWTYWDSDFYDDDFQVDHIILDAFSRVYPTATNGVPLNLHYNSTTKFFTYSFDLNTSSKNQASLTTDIFVPVHLYPNGFDVTVSSNLKWTFDAASSKIYLTLQSQILDDFENRHNYMISTVSSVTVQPK